MKRTSKVGVCCKLSILMLTGVMVASKSPLLAQETTVTGKSAPLVPYVKPEPGDLERTREKLLTLVRKIVVQEEVRDEITKKLRAAFDGKPKSALGIHVLELLTIKDETQMLMLATASIQKLQWQIELDKDAKEQLRDSTKAESQFLDEQIKTTALQVKALRENDAQSDVLPDLEREFVGKIRQRDEMLAYTAQYDALCTEYSQELAELKKFDDRLGALARVQDIEVDRRRAAIKHETSSLVSQSVNSHRQEMREVMTSISSRTKKRDGSQDTEFVPPKPLRDSLPITKPIGGTPNKPLTPDEAQLIEKELKKLSSN